MHESYYRQLRNVDTFVRERSLCGRFVPGNESAWERNVYNPVPPERRGGSVAEWLACWTQAQKARVQIAVATLSGNSLRQTVHTHRASVHQAAKLVATLLRVAGVTAGLAESIGSLPPGL